MARYRAFAEYYDAEYEGNPMLEQDVPFFLDHLPRRRQHVLELATGTARAAIPIAQAGHRVVGVDFAKDMLRIAQRKRDMVGLTERDLSLIHADVLKLKLNQTFDWVCVFFNTFLNFTTLEEQDTFLQVARRHLKPRGRLWIDIFQPNLALLAQDESHGLDVSTFFVPALDRSVTRTTDVRRDPSRQVQKITFNYDWYDEQGMHQHEELKFELTFLFPRELQLLLERNGLWIEHLYGNYDGSKLNADSPRMIACCRRDTMR